MRRQFHLNSKTRSRVEHNTMALAKRARHGVPLSKRARTPERNDQGAYSPPEDWYEPSDDNGEPVSTDYKIVVQPPGDGYRHVLTPDEIRDRLAQLSAKLLEPLEVVQLSRMTHKKRTFPCYGMQWGNSLYLYPIEATLEEYYDRPPKPAQENEARMFGGRWVQRQASGAWKLVWTWAAVKDFYLNNILIHELGHLLDSHNSSYIDRERYAEWFAIEHGYKSSTRRDLARQALNKAIRRRHHSGR